MDGRRVRWAAEGPAILCIRAVACGAWEEAVVPVAAVLTVLVVVAASTAAAVEVGRTAVAEVVVVAIAD